MNTSIKRFFIAFSFAMGLWSAASAQQSTTGFQYPEPPENLTGLTERSNYIIEHYWDRSNLKSLFSNVKNFEIAFNQFISVAPFADTTLVFNSIDHLIKEVKKSPANLQTMARMARAKLYSDSAEYLLDAVYLPFAKAAASTSGLTNEEKEQYKLEVQQLSNSQIGMKAPNIKMTLRDGTNLKLEDVKKGYIIIFFDDPEDFDNRMARTRLATDYALNQLIADGDIQVISLYPGSPDAEWQERTVSYPENWIVAASPEAYNLFDRRWKPTSYYLNSDHVILTKHLSPESLIEGFRTTYNRKLQIKAERERLRREAEERMKNGSN